MKEKTLFPNIGCIYLIQNYQLFDLEVKGQGQNVVILVHHTPSHDYTPTYQISLTYLKRQNSYGPVFHRDLNLTFDFKVKQLIFLSVFVSTVTFCLFR
jgi:hypothetical protein